MSRKLGRAAKAEPFKALKLTEARRPDLKALAAPKPERMLCVRSLNVTARIVAGEPVEVIRLPSGLALLKLGERCALIDAAALLANFKEI